MLSAPIIPLRHYIGRRKNDRHFHDIDASHSKNLIILLNSPRKRTGLSGHSYGGKWEDVITHFHSHLELGAWIHESHIKWTWTYVTVQNVITKHTDSGCRHYTLITSSYVTQHCKYFAETANPIPTKTGILVSCTQVGNTKQSCQHRIALTCLRPQWHIPQKLPISFWDDPLVASKCGIHYRSILTRMYDTVQVFP